MERFDNIQIELLQPDPNQPRKHYSEKSLIELAENMKQIGQIEPLVVREKIIEGVLYYVIVCGERRYRAALIAGINYLSCHIRELDDEKVMDIQISENLQRDDLTPLDECDFYLLLMEKKKWTMDDISARYGKSTDYIFGRIKLSQLITEVREKLEQDIIPVNAAINIASLTIKQQLDAIKRLIVPIQGADGTKEFFLGQKDFKAFFDNSILMPLDVADFNPKDDKLFACGACTLCQKRTGNSLFQEIASDDRCLDRECYHDKHVRHYQDLQLQLSKKMKVNVGFAARHYGTNNDFKDLPEVIGFIDYDPIDEIQANKESDARYVIFVGIDSSDKPGHVRHGWVKLKPKAVEKEVQIKVREDKKKAEKKEEKDWVIDRAFKVAIYNEFQNNEVKARNQSFIELACLLWSRVKTESIPFSILKDFISKYNLRFEAEIFDGDWREVLVNKNYDHPINATPLTIEIKEFRKGISELKVSWVQFIPELNFIAMISNELDSKFIRDCSINYGELKRIATTKVTEAMKADEAKKPNKKKKRVYED